MLAKLTLALAAVAAFAAPAAAGDGPLFVTQGGVGIAAGSTRYLPVPSYQSDNTILLSLSTKDATEQNQMELVGQWGLPSTPSGADGLSRDGTRLVLADTAAGQTSPSLFLVVNPKTMKIVDPITLKGWYSFDALSPDGTKLYLIDYVQGPYSGDLEHYVVRAYDLRTNRLLPGRIADRTQRSWVMQGSPMTRTKSGDGRWVYTLYTNPGGYPFIHALDTVRGVAHCVGLPLQSQSGVGNLVLGLHGRTLSVHWRSGRPFVNVDTASWRVRTGQRGGFDWWWMSLALLPLAAAGVVLARRSRHGHADELEAALADMLRKAAGRSQWMSSRQ